MVAGDFATLVRRPGSTGLVADSAAVAAAAARSFALLSSAAASLTL